MNMNFFNLKDEKKFLKYFLIIGWLSCWFSLSTIRKYRIKYNCFKSKFKGNYKFTKGNFTNHLFSDNFIHYNIPNI